MLSVSMLDVIVLSGILASVVMLSVSRHNVILSVILTCGLMPIATMLSFVMLNAVLRTILSVF